MAGSPKKRLRKTRFEEFKQQPNAIDLICERIIGGGTLVHVCRDFDIHYASVIEWVNADDDRRKRLEDSMKGREKHGTEIVLRELVDLVTVDVSQAYEEDGSLKPIHDIPENVRRFIHSLDVEEVQFDDGPVTRVKKVKFYDKMQAVTLLGKHLRMFTERHQLEVSDSLADLLARTAQP